jgi:hypothetical protein
LNRQRLVDDLAEGLKHSRPDPVPKNDAQKMAYLQYRDQHAQWEIDVRSVQQSLYTVWGEHFAWAAFWTKVNGPKEG